MEKVAPQCKYGHGNLERQPDLWAVQGVEVLDTKTDGLPDTRNTALQFTCSMFRCPRCGYLEMFDDEDAA